MAITFGAAGTLGTGTVSPATCTAPAGRASGDLIIVTVQDSGTGATITTPSGWSLIQGNVAPSTHKMWVYARIADGTATDNFSAVITSPTVWLAQCETWKGCDTSSVAAAIPVSRADTFASGPTSFTTGTVTAPASPSGCRLVTAMTEDSVNTAHTWGMGAAAPALGTGTIDSTATEASQKQSEANGSYPTTMTPSTGYTATVTISSTEVAGVVTMILAPPAAAGGTSVRLPIRALQAVKRRGSY